MNIKSTINVLLVSHFLMFNACWSQPRLVADELKNLIESDADIKQRLDVKDEYIANLLDMVEKSKMIAQMSPSMIRQVVDHLFYNFFPGAGVQAMCKGLIYLPPQKAPQLYAMLDKLSTSYGLKTPPVFLAGDKKMFNAMASSLWPSTAMVVLGKKLTAAMSDDELKSVLAHELAHVKNMDVTKQLLASIIMLFVTYKVIRYCVGKFALKTETVTIPTRTTGYISRELIIWPVLFVSMYATYKILTLLTRRHEKQADLDAIAVTQDPDAFVAAMQQIKQYVETEFEKFKNENAFLNKKIDELAANSPKVAEFIRYSAQSYAKDKEEEVKSILEENSGDHPALNTRIEYGQEIKRQMQAS
jgi:Zn-dependent protease with chaperone function